MEGEKLNTSEIVLISYGITNLDLHLLMCFHFHLLLEGPMEIYILLGILKIQLILSLWPIRSRFRYRFHTGSQYHYLLNVLLTFCLIFLVALNAGTVIVLMMTPFA